MLEKRCMKCGTKVERKAVYCPECGVNIKEWNTKNWGDIMAGKKGYKADKNQEKYLSEKPKIPTWQTVWIILALIICFPVGIIGWLYIRSQHNKKVDQWQRDKILNKIDS